VNFTQVEGKNKGQITLYALSTCPWCKKTKALLDDLGVAYEFLDVDLVSPEEREEMDASVRKWNPTFSFPTLVLNNEKVIIGYDPDKIKEALGYE